MKNNWQTKKLREVLSLEYGKGLTEKVRVNGSVPVYGSNGAVGTHNTMLVHGPGIVVGRKGSIGEVVWSDSDFWPIDTTYYIQLLQNDKLRYIYYLLQTLKLKSLNKASGVPGLNREDVYKITVSLPSLDVQQQIVNNLDAIRKLQELKQKEIEKAQELFDSFITSQLFSKGVNKVYRFEDISTFQYGLTAEGKDKGEYRFIRITDIDETGQLRSIGKKYVEADRKQVEKYLLKDGDLLVARTGATYGKFIYCEPLEPSVFASYLIKLSFKLELVFPRFVWLFTRTERYWIQAKKLVTGSGQPQFNANRVKELEIPLPSLNKQKEIVTEAEQLLIYSNNLKKEQTILKELFESTLNKLMRPNYEK